MSQLMVHTALNLYTSWIDFIHGKARHLVTSHGTKIHAARAKSIRIRVGINDF